MRKPAIAVAVLGALVSLVGSRPALATMNLATLLTPGATYRSGDEVYDEFTFISTGDMPSASHILVYGLFGDNAGLRFQAAFADGIGGGSSDSTISFRVTSLAEPFVDAELEGDPKVQGENGVATVTETFGGTSDGSIGVFDIPLGSGHNTQTFDHLIFAEPTQSLRVQQQIHLESINGAATLTYLDQRFSRSVAVPEPGSLAVLSVGAIGLLPLMRRRRA
jgi:hypothetical protein